MSHAHGSSEGERDEIRQCQRHGRQLAAGLLTFDDYAEKVTTTLLEADAERLPVCLDAIQPDTLGRYAEYLRGVLLPTDFMPYPRIFFVEKNTDAERERLRQHRRPRYVAIYEGVLARLPT